jgi:hypothetical protein
MKPRIGLGTYICLQAYSYDRPHPPPLVLGRPPWT